MSLGQLPFGRVRAKLAGMNKTQEERDRDIEYEEKCLWMNIYGCLLICGLDLFEPAGLTSEQEGLEVECLQGLRTHFERREAYGRAAFVHKIILEYQKRWPGKI
jgi:hypothetical protein